jgi:hypothetical protein
MSSQGFQNTDFVSYPEAFIEILMLGREESGQSRSVYFKSRGVYPYGQ